MIKTRTHTSKIKYIVDCIRYFFLPKRVRRLKRFTSGFNSSIETCFFNDDNSLLPRLCDKYGSDKGGTSNSGSAFLWSPHAYTDYYSRIWSHCRTKISTVFECGVGDLSSNMEISGKPGASLRVWRDYFPNATIIGADIDENILFQEQRIKTYHVDQTNPEMIKKMWANIEIKEFDIMIDDGLHTFNAAVCLFENSISKLAAEGLYIIEDMSLSSLKKFRDYFSDKAYHVDFVSISQSFNPSPNRRNNLIVIRN